MRVPARRELNEKLLQGVKVVGMEEFRTAARKPRLAPGEGMDGGEAVKRLKFQHEPLIDAMLENPRIMNKELAEQFGFSVGWVGRLINSDAFQARLAQRKKELTDPKLAKQINARLNGVAVQAMEVLSRKLEASDSAELALQALGVATAAQASPKGAGK